LKSVGLEAPFVGRDRELRLIKDLFHSSATESTAHLVSVLGIAGLGRSRLVWEFFKYIDGLADLTFWHRGRCLAYGEGVTYWALAEMVKSRARILEDEEPGPAAAKLHTVVEELVVRGMVQGSLERRWSPRLAALLSPHFSVCAARHRAPTPRGVPAVDLIDFDYGPGPSPGAWWHTRRDDLSHVCAGSLGEVGTAALAAVPAIRVP